MACRAQSKAFMSRTLSDLVLAVCLLGQVAHSQSLRSTSMLPSSKSSVLDKLHGLLFRAKPAQTPSQERIPKILHRIFLSGEKELRKAATGPDPPMRLEWSENCALQHQDWQIMFWDMKSALELLRLQYPWFLETFQSYKRRVQQGDALRYFVLNSYGGVYMDMDVECFRPNDSFLKGFDLVLNVELRDGYTVTNAVMASAPNVTFWQRVFTAMQERHALQNDFLETEVVSTTGPWMLTDSLKEHLHIQGRASGEYIRPTGETLAVGKYEHPVHVNEVVKVYEVGAWFTPCIFDDEQCHLDLIQSKEQGTVDLSRLAGYHRYQGTWKPCMGECFKSEEHRTKGEQNPLQGLTEDSMVSPAEDSGRESPAPDGLDPAMGTDENEGGSTDRDSNPEREQVQQDLDQSQTQSKPAPSRALLKHTSTHKLPLRKPWGRLL